MPEQRTSPSWPTELWRRVRKQAWLKAACNAVFLIVFFRAYLAIQRHPLFEVIQIPATPVDQWIGFQPWALWPYISLWVYTALPAALQPDCRGLVRYGLHMGAMCLAALAVFLLWPTSVSDAVGLRPGGGAFEVLNAVDNAGNACPSLHVAASVLCCLWLRVTLVDIGTPRWLHVLNVAWCIAICWSTLVVKQHLFIDLVAGAALGLLAGYWSLRTPRSRHARMQ